jgi:hypothetical protein
LGLACGISLQHNKIWEGSLNAVFEEYMSYGTATSSWLMHRYLSLAFLLRAARVWACHFDVYTEMMDIFTINSAKKKIPEAIML